MRWPALLITILCLGGCNQSSPEDVNKRKPFELPLIANGQRLSEAAEIDPNVFQEYTRDQWPDTFSAWDVKGIKKIQTMRVKAARVVAEDRSCDRVETADIAPSGSVPPHRPVVWVECQNGLRRYFTQNDLK